MSAPTRATPAQLGFLAIYNPSLGTTDETIEDQIVYYSTPGLQERRTKDAKAKRGVLSDAEREENNEQLRQIGLAQGMVEFGRSFSDGQAVDTVETEKSRIILHELESGWWILASINLTVLPNTMAGKGKDAEQQPTTEYSSREVKPAILILGDLLRAHSTFLLHHAASLSALFVRTKRSKFMGILGRYWDTFLTTWNVLMHGNPANNLYSGIKVAACGELGMGVGEEERGSGEREVLEGLIGRVDGLVDVIVSKFGEKDPPESEDRGRWKSPEKQTPVEPWLGSGNEPSSDDGAVFLGTGALSRKSLRDVSHWMEDLYRWGPYTYGVIDNPSSNRRTKRFQRKPAKERSPSLDVKKSRQVYQLSLRDKVTRDYKSRQISMTSVPPMPVTEREESSRSPDSSRRRPTIKRNEASVTGSESDVNAKGNRFVQYLKLGYGTHWSLGSTPSTGEYPQSESAGPKLDDPSKLGTQANSTSAKTDGTFESSPYAPKNSSTGHYLIGLLGNIENENSDPAGGGGVEEDLSKTKETSNSRLLLRTITVELEREEDARKEDEISIDLGGSSKGSSTKFAGSERSAGGSMASMASYDSQDRNKTKKVRTVVYVNKPFVFVFLFELRTDALAMSGLYRSLHYQISPLLKSLSLSTAYRASKPELNPSDELAAPIYDLVWDPKLLTMNSTIPNIPDPLVVPPAGPTTWSRIEALNTHMQIINTYIASSTNRAALERTCKTSRGWWVVWTKIPDPEPPGILPETNDLRIPTPIPEESTGSRTPGLRPQEASMQTSTVGASVKSGAAHPFLETAKSDYAIKDKEIFLIRRASDHVGAMTSGRFVSGSSVAASESSWTSGPGKLAQGIGVDTKRYIEGLLNMNR
ncbi:hypothetical protein WAI453_005766 [Rhynchosporium graminicola]|uniref:CCZ1/INTU/HSP4 first Longin domain-containing protein n=1 Tax=Rhynchosporium graminicola TaxID=2792576 RepID=A0A1E1KKD8_9HELO|nr:uncharacterized protein RCO7_04152 [Rhynchosporium commune]